MALLAIAVAGGAVAYISANQTDTAPINSQPQTGYEAPTSQDYPALWTQAGLPQYPGANIIAKSEGNNLKEGVEVTFTTLTNLTAVAGFYNQEMVTVRGFSPPSAASESAYNAVFKKDKAEFTVSATVDENGLTTVKAKYVEL